MSGLLWLLMLCCAVRGYEFDRGIINTFWNKSVDHRDKIYSIFNLIQHKRVNCAALTGEHGTCMSKKECTDHSGLASGKCAQYQGICCVIKKRCDSETKLNGTYFTNPDYPEDTNRPVDCTINVFKKNTNICQLRLDFHDVHLAQPNTGSKCVEDVLQITGGSTVPILCGDNSGHHVYVDFLPGNIPIRINVQTSQTSVASKWNIRITQIECTSPDLAPQNVLMYFTELQGRVKSFNYNPDLSDPVGTRQLANTNYVVGVRKAPNKCGIEWMQDPDDKYSFTVSCDTGGVQNLLGNATVAGSGDVCTGDFIVIPNTSLQRDRFCSNALVTVTTSTKPFTLTVVTDDKEKPTDFGNRGFSLLYRQLPCS